MIRTSMTAAALVALAACSTSGTNPNGLPRDPKAALEFVCEKAPGLHLGFQAVLMIAPGVVSPRVVQSERIAFVNIQRICQTPPATAIGAVIELLQAWNELQAAFAATPPTPSR
jgi:hypothetical protein